MSIHLHTRGSEAQLMKLVDEVRPQRTGWRALHFHLNDLLEQYKSEYQVKIAVNLMHDLLKNYEGGIFVLINSSIMVLCKGLEKPVEQKLIFQLRYLYMDDPLAYMDNGNDNPGFCTVYDAKRDWQAFLETCSQRLAAYTRHKSSNALPEKEKAREEPKEAGGTDFSAFTLASIVRELNRASLSQVIRRQPVCAMLPGAAARRVFDELYIHISHLRQTLKSEVDFLSDRWLFKYLTHILDERMIDLISAAPAQYLGSPVSLNLNVETLLSTHFSQLDSVMSPQARVSIVIEIPIVDVFADMGAYTLARAEVQKLGYRVCLDGLTNASFASISRERLGADLVKVQWNAEAKADAEMAQAVQITGANRVILCRCDNKSAIEYGQALGISLFQGRYIDGVLNPGEKVEN